MKQSRSDEQSTFTHEVNILQRLKGSLNVVELLATFTYRNMYHFILPWASGGTLRDFWRQHKTVSSLPAVLPWVFDQLQRLAHSLADMHDHHAGSIIHGDIKPENILHFTSGAPPGDISGSLKFTDFGLAQIINPGSSQKIEFCSPTYRAPETESDTSPDAILLPYYDIWSLGCVYLEFVCWLMLGWNGVEAFAQSRFEESGTNTKFKEDSFFTKIEKEPQYSVDIKDSVRQVYSLGEP